MTASSQADAEAKRTLRFWALCDVIYGVALATLVLTFVPWKWPLANVVLLTYLAAHVATAPGLWRQQRWAWRMATTTAFVGLSLAVISVAGLVASWAYLKGVYGSFGKGASLVSLLLAATAGQVLGLYPALRLRALLRHCVRAQMQAGRAAATGMGVVLGLCLGLPMGLYNHHRMVVQAPTPVATAQAALGWMRAALQTSAPAEAAELRLPLRHETLIVSLFDGGHMVARAQGQGATWQQALKQVHAQLASHASVKEHLQGRLKLDHPLGFAPVLTWPAFAEALGFEPGRDGLRVVGDSTAMLLPDDVIAADVYGTTPLLPFLPEVRLGISPDWVRQQLNAPPHAQLQRFATESWMECAAPNTGVCGVQRGVVQLPTFTTKNAALAAGQYMLQHQKPDGTFTYVYRPWLNLDQPAGYNFARHAGTAYTLALLAPLAPELGFAAGGAQALQWLMSHAAPVCGDHLCVREGPLAKVGNNALALLALIAYQESSQDQSWATSSAGLARFLLSLQKPSGDLVPAYLPNEQRPAQEMPAQMFASEEAAFALAKAGRVLGDPKLIEAAARLLNFLTQEKYADFLGRFSYGADSWTCMAAAELPASVVQANVVDFCLGYADFLARLQFGANEHDPAFAGHYGFSHVLVPQAPAAAGFAEALTATLQLARAHRRSTTQLQPQVVAALNALKRDQLRPGNDHMALVPERAWGGIRRSVVQSDVRIDFVQHAAAALAHGVALGL